MSRDHPTNPELAAWLDDELPDRRRRELTEHIEACSPCRDEVRCLERTSSSLGDLPERARPPEDAWAEVEASVDVGAGSGDGNELRWRRWAAGVSAAAGVAAILWVYVGSGGGAGPIRGEQGGPVAPAGPGARAIQTLDSAVTDIREALSRDPDDPYLQRYLARTRRFRSELERENRLERGVRSADPSACGQGGHR